MKVAARHRRPHDPPVSRSALRDASTQPRRPCGARRFPRAASSRLQGLRQRDAAIADAGHARSVVAPARCVDHVVRHQAAGGDARARTPNGLRTSAATAGSRTCGRRRRLVGDAVTAPPAGEPAPLFARADDSGFIHAPSVDARRGRGAAAQRASRRRPACRTRDSPFAIDLSSRRVREAARLLDGRAPGAAARRAARLSLRAQPARPRPRSLRRAVARSRAARGAPARSDGAARRADRGEQRRRRAGAAAASGAMRRAR